MSPMKKKLIWGALLVGALAVAAGCTATLVEYGPPYQTVVIEGDAGIREVPPAPVIFVEQPCPPPPQVIVVDRPWPPPPPIIVREPVIVYEPVIVREPVIIRPCPLPAPRPIIIREDIHIEVDNDIIRRRGEPDPIIHRDRDKPPVPDRDRSPVRKDDPPRPAPAPAPDPRRDYHPEREGDRTNLNKDVRDQGRAKDQGRAAPPPSRSSKEEPAAVRPEPSAPKAAPGGYAMVPPARETPQKAGYAGSDDGGGPDKGAGRGARAR